MSRVKGAEGKSAATLLAFWVANLDPHFFEHLVEELEHVPKAARLSLDVLQEQLDAFRRSIDVAVCEQREHGAVYGMRATTPSTVNRRLPASTRAPAGESGHEHGAMPRTLLGGMGYGQLCRTESFNAPLRHDDLTMGCHGKLARGEFQEYPRVSADRRHSWSAGGESDKQDIPALDLHLLKSTPSPPCGPSTPSTDAPSSRFSNSVVLEETAAERLSIGGGICRTTGDLVPALGAGKNCTVPAEHEPRACRVVVAPSSLHGNLLESGAADTTGDRLSSLIGSCHCVHSMVRAELVRVRQIVEACERFCGASGAARPTPGDTTLFVTVVALLEDFKRAWAESQSGTPRICRLLSDGTLPCCEQPAVQGCPGGRPSVHSMRRVLEPTATPKIRRRISAA